MNVEHSQHYCKMCRRHTLHIRSSQDEAIATGLMIFITLATCGVGMPLGIFVWYITRPKPRCTQCGSRP